MSSSNSHRSVLKSFHLNRLDYDLTNQRLLGRKGAGTMAGGWVMDGFPCQNYIKVTFNWGKFSLNNVHRYLWTALKARITFSFCSLDLPPLPASWSPIVYPLDTRYLLETLQPGYQAESSSYSRFYRHRCNTRFNNSVVFLYCVHLQSYLNESGCSCSFQGAAVLSLCVFEEQRGNSVPSSQRERSRTPPLLLLLPRYQPTLYSPSPHSLSHTHRRWSCCCWFSWRTRREDRL